MLKIEGTKKNQIFFFNYKPKIQSFDLKISKTGKKKQVYIFDNKTIKKTWPQF